MRWPDLVARHHVLLTFLVVPGCLPPKTYNVTQTGIVPAPRPMPYDGQPVDGWLRIEGRHTQVVTSLDQAPGSDSGNVVSRTYAGLAIRGAHRDTDFGVELDAAWSEGAQKTSDDLGPPPDERATQHLMVLRHSFRAAPTFRIGVGGAIGKVDVPIRIGRDEIQHDTAGVAQVAVVPSWRDGPVSVFGSVTLTTEVHVPRTLTFLDGEDALAEANMGTNAIVYAAGASYAFDSGVRLSGQLALPMASEQARHGVQLDLGLGFDFGTKF